MEDSNWKFKRVVNEFFYRLRNRRKFIKFLIFLISFFRNFGFLKKRQCDNKIKKAFSVDNGFIYFANPKVATRTILQLLESQSYSDLTIAEKSVSEVHKYFEDNKICFTFTFVRNPWARVYSCWKDKITNDHKFCDIFILTKYKGLYPDMPFEEFVNWVDSVEGSDAFADRHWLSQVELLKNEQGEVDLAYIGKVESIDIEFNSILSSLNIPDPVRLRRNNSTVTEFEKYKSAYNEKTKMIVFKRYQRDVELFNYKF